MVELAILAQGQNIEIVFYFKLKFINFLHKILMKKMVII